jgi:hypothetical protein
MLLRPDNPSLLGAVLSQRLSVLTSLQRKRFLCRERLRLLRCSGALSALLMRLSAVDGCSGHVIAQHKVIDRIMWRVFSGATLKVQEKVQLQLARATFEIIRARPTLCRNSRVVSQAAAAARIADKVSDIWVAAIYGDLALVKDHLVLQPALIDQGYSSLGFDP